MLFATPAGISGFPLVGDIPRPATGCHSHPSAFTVERRMDVVGQCDVQLVLFFELITRESVENMAWS